MGGIVDSDLGLKCKRDLGYVSDLQDFYYGYSSTINFCFQSCFIIINLNC